MFSFCADPTAIEGLTWLSCYLTTGKHMAFYLSFLVVLVLLALAAPAAMLFGFAGALACRSRLTPVRLLGQGYITMVRGIPDIAFFLFVPVALDQAFEFLRHKTFCNEITQPVWRGNLAGLSLIGGALWVLVAHVQGRPTHALGLESMEQFLKSFI